MAQVLNRHAHRRRNQRVDPRDGATREPPCGSHGDQDADRSRERQREPHLFDHLAKRRLVVYCRGPFLALLAPMIKVAAPAKRCRALIAPASTRARIPTPQMVSTARSLGVRGQD